MYKQRNTRKQNFSRSKSRSKNGRQGKPIDVSHFINKTPESSKSEEYQVINKFHDFQLNPGLEHNIHVKGYTSPTEIQDKTIPDSLLGRDIVGVAGTGTGKTAAFLIPVIEKLLHRGRDQSVLIIAPTRELVNQIFQEYYELTKGLQLYATTLIGGTNITNSLRALKKTNHVVIATPGRLNDMVERGAIKLHKFHTLVLDEFDRMLDMGFKDEILDVNERMSHKEQTLLFSATMQKNQQKLVDIVTNDPIYVTAQVKTHDTSAIVQDVLKVGNQKRMEMVHELIQSVQNEKVILFCETKRLVDKVHRYLRDLSVLTDLIHGDKTQNARQKALNRFRSGSVNVLVATDVLARGIDVDDVSLVINYQAPRTHEDYVHRIGRTGRAGKKGRAVTLVD